jgi:ribosomal-protein-alanine N-acetyltransferase
VVYGNRFATESTTAVVGWAAAHLPDHPVIAGSLRVAARTGLRRAEHLDSPGEDDLDLIFTSGWPDRGSNCVSSCADG